MKKAFTSMIFGLALILMIGAVSATTICSGENTIVDGTVYVAGTDPLQGVSGASVNVTCYHGSYVNSLITTSDVDGHYSVLFSCSSECDYGDNLIVTAKKEGVTGTAAGEIDTFYNLPCNVILNLGVVDIPLVPEFGAIVGVLTVLGAVSVFFVVRRK